MTINAAFTARTTDGVSSGYAVGASGQAKIQVDGESVMDGAQIEIEECSEDDTDKYSFSGGEDAIISQPGTRILAAPEGYFVRVRQAGSRANTSVNVTITTV